MGLPSLIGGPTGLLISITDLFSAPNYELRTRVTQASSWGWGQWAPSGHQRGTGLAPCPRKRRVRRQGGKWGHQRRSSSWAKTGPHTSHEHGTGFLQWPRREESWFPLSKAGDESPGKWSDLLRVLGQINLRAVIRTWPYFFFHCMKIWTAPPFRTESALEGLQPLHEGASLSSSPQRPEPSAHHTSLCPCIPTTCILGASMDAAIDFHSFPQGEELKIIG